MKPTRRQFLGASVAGALAFPCRSLLSAETMQIRNRRIVVQHDVYHVMRNYAGLHPDTTAPFEPFRDAVFSYIDEPQSQIDAIWWDIGGNTVSPAYPSKVLPPVEHPLLRAWLDSGVDWVKELVDETRRRKCEVFWSHRISEVDGLPEGGHATETMHPLKAAHPDWVVPCSYWWQGMWNLAAEGLREHKVAELRELATNYDLDGIQIDYARHMPILPAGRQWEMREHVTEFMNMVRNMLNVVGKDRGRPVLLAARVPRNLEGCHVDGLDVSAWAERGLVDILTLGSRSMDVDVEGFREAVGENVQLQPCFDDHHTTDGYRYGPIEFLRGVFANHWQRGANSVVAFNWPIGPAEVAETVGGEIGSPTQGIAFQEVGDPETMSGKDKIFAVERRGGYPWCDGFFNRNDTSPLPAELHDGKPTEFTLHISDPPAENARLFLRAILFGATRDDTFSARLNGTDLEEADRDSGWKDPQISSPKPQPTSGGKGNYKIDPNQQLIRLDFTVPPDGWERGKNKVEIRISPRPTKSEPVQLEKVEAHLFYF